MATKTCKKCGWEIDRKNTLRSCPVCHTKYDEGYCCICGAYCTGNDYVKHNYCRDCYNEVYGAPTRAIQRKAAIQANKDMYNEWYGKMLNVPADYHTLTEDEWLEVCKHFNGCAICGDMEISARAFFIPFKEGGRYCNWNIIPVCEACSIRWQTVTKMPTHTPFSNYLQLTNGKQTLQNIKEYLEVRLDAAQR